MKDKTVLSFLDRDQVYREWERGLGSIDDLMKATEQAVLQSPEIQQMRKDAERLDFMIENMAWAQPFERDGSILQYRLMTQNEDEDYVFMSGEDRYFNTPRDAIDAAMEQKA